MSPAGDAYRGAFHLRDHIWLFVGCNWAGPQAHAGMDLYESG